MNLDSLIKGLNDGDYHTIERIRVVFGSLPRFIKHYVKKRNKLDELDLYNLWQQSSSKEEESFNSICKDVLDQAGPKHFVQYIADVTYEDGTYYFNPWILKEFDALFIGTHSDIVKGVFDSDWYEHFETENYINYFYDILKILNENNKKYLKNKILEISHGHVFKADDFENPPYDYFNQNDNFIVADNIDDIMKISELFNEVIELNQLFVLKLELENLYAMSYNEAWNEVMYDRIWDSLSDFFNPKFTWVNDKPKIKIIDFPGFLWTFLNCFNGYRKETLVNQFDLLGFLHALISYSCLEQPTFSILNNPPVDGVNQYINNSFYDYIS
jgi:hypothetical protein